MVPAQTQGDDTADLFVSIPQAWNTADFDSSSSWEAENDHDFNNPLMVGIGFQDAMYDG
jgi:hypothetical protein